MQDRYTMFRRGAVLYYEDRTTGQQKSLRTRDESEARRILQAKNDAVNQRLGRIPHLHKGDQPDYHAGHAVKACPQHLYSLGLPAA